jgi:HD superfamily phosphohydrolase YqeK
MFTSVQAGVANMNSSAHAFFLLPVDIPLVRPTTIAKLLDEALDSEQLIVYPTWNGRRGHPPLISVSLIPEILNWDGEGGLRAVLRRHEDAAVEVSVEDEHILLDADTPEHYADLVRRQALLVTPPTAECEAILSCRFRSKPEVADHCRKVASVARRLGLLLVQMGHELDLDLMNAGAMLHDIAKGFPNHPEKGARLLRKMGYPGVAELIACHMDCTWTKGQPVTAKEVVFLADKLTTGNAMTPLARKFEQSASRLSRDSTALSALEQRRQTAEAIKERVEEIMGRSLEEIFPELKANRFHEPPNDPSPETR